MKTGRTFGNFLFSFKSNAHLTIESIACVFEKSISIQMINGDRAHAITIR